MKDDYAALDVASHLDNDEVVAQYLAAAAEERDPRVFVAAIAAAAQADGLANLPLGSPDGQKLSAALSANEPPSFELISSVLRQLGFKFSIERVSVAASSLKSPKEKDFVG